MRVSLTARFVSHPAIAFRARRTSGRRLRLGLDTSTVTYHVPRAARGQAPTLGALRSQTSRFRFPSVGRVGRVGPRRALQSLGLPRARRG
ncbi:MAG TPA: hypothetical protein VI733_03510 [Candidatus Limnocylindria bacterium]|nr:hypothetical protein [Candidatus Limnocylindria bacterium]